MGWAGPVGLCSQAFFGLGHHYQMKSFAMGDINGLLELIDYGKIGMVPINFVKEIFFER